MAEFFLRFIRDPEIASATFFQDLSWDYDFFSSEIPDLLTFTEFVQC